MCEAMRKSLGVTAVSIAVSTSLAACSAWDTAAPEEEAGAGSAGVAAETRMNPLGAGSMEPERSAWALFADPDSDLETADVHDSDREVVRFDSDREELIWADDGSPVEGWTVNGRELSWELTPIRFRVEFGTERGQRRAYFTEVSSGTICDLSLVSPGLLSILTTAEAPPTE